MMKNKELILYSDICLRFAKESHCISKKVCCMAIKEGRIVATGINGTPKGCPNCDTVFDPNDFDREEHHAWSLNRELHAEQNMIAFCAREGISLKDCEIIVSLMPCRDCSKLLIALKPKAVYYINDYDKGESESKKLFEEAGIPLTKINMEKE